MEEKILYDPTVDPYFADPYIDVEEWRTTPVPHLYIHGGFHGTEKAGNEVRFCLYFPEKEVYEGRFYQYLSPAPEDEHESEHLTGEDDKISFCLTHGAYYVVSNQGGFILNDGTRLYRSSAATAMYSRKVAKRVYGYEHRPYGYVFGGSGGSFKTLSCVEMTEGVWEGSVPYVLANPMATPNVFAPRMKAVRLLGEEGLKKVAAAMEPGGSGNIYEGLEEQQRAALEEATKMGFPERAWFCHPFMGDGALMVLAPNIYQIFPNYFKDFWTVEGYEGADPDSSEARDRVQFVTTVEELLERKKPTITEEFTSVDNSWQNTMIGNQDTPDVKMEELPPEGAYLYHCRLRVLNGAAAGKEVPIDTIENGVIRVSSAFDGRNTGNALEGIAAGDQIMIDNSDYLAMQNFHRHQVPDCSYQVYDQFRDGEGNPIPAQLPFLLPPLIAAGGGGSVPTGDFHGKMIAVCSLLDESACPWHGDWYRREVQKNPRIDEEENFRLYYNDNCIHDDRAGFLEDPQRQVDYLGVLHQALLDVAAWCEKGIAPAPTTNYEFVDGQIRVPKSAEERGGLQPVVEAYVNGEKAIHVKAGESVTFTARIEVPAKSGFVTKAAWDYEAANDFSQGEELQKESEGSVLVSSTHSFEKPGTYFPVIKVQSNRHGTLEDIFTQCKNLDRVKVVVSE